MRRCHPASGFCRRLIRAVSSRFPVSLYLGLLNRERPFRGNLSEGSVLFVEFHHSTTFGPLSPTSQTVRWPELAG